MVALADPPTESNTLMVTEPAGVPAGIVTLTVAPAQVPVSVASLQSASVELQAINRFDEVVVYGAVPPEIVNVAGFEAVPVVPEIEIEPGTIAKSAGGGGGGGGVGAGFKVTVFEMVDFIPLGVVTVAVTIVLF